MKTDTEKDRRGKGKFIMDPRKHTCSRKCFTLIELLVVVAIVAILAGLLLPALNKARERAKAIACVANFSSLGKAMLLYTADNQDYITPHRNDPGYTSGVTRMWYFSSTVTGLISNYLQTSQGGVIVGCDISGGKIWKGKFQCPSYVPPADWQTWSTPRAFSIGLNSHLTELFSSGTLPKIGRLKKTSRGAHALEAWKDPYVNRYHPLTDTSSRMELRHSGMTNVVYVDGHVDARNGTERIFKASDGYKDDFWTIN